MSKLSKIIITGASGQIGFYLREFLLNNTDCLIYGISKYGDEIFPDTERIKMLYGDIRYPASMEKCVKEIKPDYFINLAGVPKNNLCEKSPLQSFDVNANGVLNILKALYQNSPNCRFFNAGSAYELRKNDLYSTTKKCAREIVRCYRDKGMYAIQGYLGHSESERRTNDYVVKKITFGVAQIKKALDQKKHFLPIELGNLEEKLDITHSSDIAEGIWKMLNQERYNINLFEKVIAWENKKPFIPGFGQVAFYEDLRIQEALSPNIEEYILASGKSHSIREIVELALKKVGFNNYRWLKDIDPKEEGLWDEESDNLLIEINPKFYNPITEPIKENSNPAYEELGWKPKISFEEIISRMVNYDLINS